jgi:hypothetical protein
MSSNNKKPVPLSISNMNKMSNSVYAHTCPSGVYVAATSDEGVTGKVTPYRTQYDQHLNDKFCYSRQNVYPNKYKS